MDYPTLRDFNREVRSLAEFFFDIQWEHGPHLKECTKKELMDYLERLEDTLSKTLKRLGFKPPIRG